MNTFKATNPTMVAVNAAVMSVAVGYLVWMCIKSFMGDATTFDVLTLIVVLTFWQIFNVVGIAAGAHRYFSHYSFKCNRFWQYTMAYFCMVSLVGPPCIWAEAHVKHHKHSDTDDDPYLKWMLSGKQPFKHTTAVSNKFLARMVKKDRLHFLTLKYYWLYVLGYVFVSAVVGAFIPGMSAIDAVFYFWAIPAGMSQITLRVVLWTGHQPSLGYRNYETRDTSNNWWVMSLIAAGEGWHNNHHKHPGSPKAGEKWWELDITWWFIKLIKQ